jgi:UDP-N-acetyl-2-amino-2-deoxyglucuronate dehydrogenase
MTVDGSELKFTGGFGDLHTRVYGETLAGRGFTIADARPAIELVQRVRSNQTATVTIAVSASRASARRGPHRRGATA